MKIWSVNLDFSFNSILDHIFMELHPAAFGFLLVTAHQLQLISGQIVGQIYSSSISLSPWKPSI